MSESHIFASLRVNVVRVDSAVVRPVEWMLTDGHKFDPEEIVETRRSLESSHLNPAITSIQQAFKQQDNSSFFN